ncbi:GDP-mannose 4,6-dehydratase [Primorskyibacter sp. S187A]|uniref:GDP-mannose 4,6-dehydratase n=1 Tax=Primorskyibacter sp. S187A TaxID=3415130 RepID=UPI003C7C2215
MTAGYWHNKSVLVTGCTGLVGSWLCAELVAQGARVVGIVRDHVAHSNMFDLSLHEQMDYVRGDICDYEFVLRAINEYEVDTLFHLAAQTIVGIANRAPLSTFDTNIRGTWNLMEAARLSPTIKRVVVASSDKAYGAQEVLPYLEDAPLMGLHPYDASKSCCDLIAQTYHHTYGLPVGVSRCGNIFGGGDLNWNRIFPETFKAAYENRAPVIRSDGSPTRDYLYVKDVADAYLCLAQAQDDEALRGRAYNFSYELPRTVLEIVDEILSTLGKGHLKPDVQGDGPPKGEIPAQFLSAVKARKELGWKPKFGLQDGITESYAWYAQLLDRIAARQS